ncbi:MAG: hypothetical protein AAF664_13725 [Planctomycetota bacterium]
MDSNEPIETPQLLQLGDRISILPIIHGSGQFATLVRRWMLDHDHDALAVAIPPSFGPQIEEAIRHLPRPAIVLQQAEGAIGFERTSWQPDPEEAPVLDDFGDSDAEHPSSYVPVEPCQGVIAGIAAAIGEHIPRYYIDRESECFQPYSAVMPDPFAVRDISPEKFAAAVLPSITRPADRETRIRLIVMAQRLRELELRHDKILMICSVIEWPWLREAYHALSSEELQDHPVLGNLLPIPPEPRVETPRTYRVDPRTFLFFMGELPFITGLYERAREDLDDDRNMQIDGVKELLIAARSRYRNEFARRGRKITTSLLSQCLKYTRNLTLMHRRMTPDLVTIVTAAKQILGDAFALQVAEVAAIYGPLDGDGSPTGQLEAAIKLGEDPAWSSLPTLTMGIDQARMNNDVTLDIVNRLPGPPVMWQRVELKKRPDDQDKSRWKHRWNPFSQCSYPPEDDRIENFRSRVTHRAQAIIGSELAKTEKFTTSVKDGIDIRDTLRHWYEKQIYVKTVPPSRGVLDACVMLFDCPADPRTYTWRTTWFAEHKEESTLAFFATDFASEMVGPGICLSNYGGAMMLFPPVMIPDIWLDDRLDFTETLEERLIAAACLHSRSRQIAFLSGLPPGGGFRRLARRFKKQLIHVPLSSFSDEQVQQLRMVHVLNGTEVRSYAANFIRKA